MAVKIKRDCEPGCIPVTKLERGVVAVITGGDHAYAGTLVQRDWEGTRLMILGKNDGWSNLANLSFQVRILPPGTELVIE